VALLFLIPRVIAQHDGLGRILCSFKSRNDLDVRTDANILGLLGALRIEVDVVILIVRHVVNGKESAMDVQKCKRSHECEGGARRGRDDDFAGYAAVSAFWSKLDVYQRAGLDLLERRGSCSAADACFLVDTEVDRYGVDAVTQREFAVRCIDGHDLTIGVSRWRIDPYADIACKNVMPRVVQHGVNVNALTLL